MAKGNRKGRPGFAQLRNGFRRPRVIQPPTLPQQPTLTPEQVASLNRHINAGAPMTTLKRHEWNGTTMPLESYVQSGKSADVKCDKDHIGSLSQHHIDANGVVTPSVICHAGCGWHVWATLEGWKPPTEQP